MKRIAQMIKQITKLVELFREFRKFFQSKIFIFFLLMKFFLFKDKREIGESISEPIRNVSALAQNLELNVMLEKFADLNRVLFENSNSFVGFFSLIFFLVILF